MKSTDIDMRVSNRGLNISKNFGDFSYFHNCVCIASNIRRLLNELIDYPEFNIIFVHLNGLICFFGYFLACSLDKVWILLENDIAKRTTRPISSAQTPTTSRTTTTKTRRDIIRCVSKQKQM